MNHETEILEKRPYLDTLSPLVNLSSVGKVGAPADQLPRYQPGTLEKYPDGDCITLTERIQIVGHHNPSGRGYVCAVHPAGRIDNLKRGERKTLKRQNLTTYAKRMIVSAGDALQDMVTAGKFKYTTLITLSYRKNVPDHQTAKKHLANWFRAMKRAGYCKFYAWAAQNQNGERSKKMGLESYRAKYGDGIHFHILSTRIPIEKAREHWRRIVYQWEADNNLKSEPISGVNVIRVNNASRYVSRYITTEDKAGTILGNMWGMSAELRALSKYTKTNPTTITVNEWRDYIRTYKMQSPGFEVYQKQLNERIFVAKDWKRVPIVFFRSVPRGLNDIFRYKRHLRTLEKILYDAKVITI